MIVRGYDISLLPVWCPVRVVAFDPKYPEGRDLLGVCGRLVKREPLNNLDVMSCNPDIVSRMRYDDDFRARIGHSHCFLTLGDAVEVLSEKTDG